jgi:hypothetical protein
MRHYALPFAASAGAGIALAPLAEAQTAGNGASDPTVIVLAALVLIALVALIVITLRNRGAASRGVDDRFDRMDEQLSHVRGMLDPDVPEGKSDSLEHWMARLQSDHAGLMGAANALRRKLETALADIERLKAEMETERRLKKTAEEGLATAKLDLANAHRTHKETLVAIERERDNYRGELEEVLGEHFATDRVAKRIKEQHPELHGATQKVH